MAELVQPPEGNAGASSNRANLLANLLTCQTCSRAAHKQSTFVDSPELFQKVMPLGQIRFDSLPDQLGNGQLPLPSGLATIDQQQALLSIPEIDVQSFELAAP